LAEATVYLALAPKSNRAYLAIDRALADIEASGFKPVPPQLRSSGGVGYRYPHDESSGISKQHYGVDQQFYEPSNHGLERALAERLKQIRQILGRD
jgi:putative ATPase